MKIVRENINEIKRSETSSGLGSIGVGITAIHENLIKDKFLKLNDSIPELFKYDEKKIHRAYT